MWQYMEFCGYVGMALFFAAAVLIFWKMRVYDSFLYFLKERQRKRRQRKRKKKAKTSGMAAGMMLGILCMMAAAVYANTELAPDGEVKIEAAELAQAEKTKTAAVELAQYKYRLPRLAGMGTKLSRLGAGIGTRGPGETKLETDRRHIRQRISCLEAELKEITARRELMHRRRKKDGVLCAAIVGYTNVGKSTLLKALELGVYNHIQGDGREYVITDDTAMKIRAEDGRSIQKTDISMFINDLPNGKDTAGFCTEDASGSTSQAANVVESIEAGTSLLLIDEDTSATNFMIRDELMQRVIHRDMEPITPFIERIKELYEDYGISTVIVAGSSGAYFHIADSIIQMDRYVPKDITGYAKKEAESFPMISGPEEAAKRPDFRRCPRAGQAFKGNDRIKMKTMGREAVMINKETIDLRYVEQITDSEQVTALGYCMRYAQKHILDGRKDLRAVVDELERVIERGTLAALCESNSSVSCMVAPRRQEIFACFNRYRGMKF